ncbi:MAG: SDR family oxidoreductase [Chloroflexi bacterium]|nr:SDR family oxidoreductase [Chloroflexota bacterium]
MNHAELTRLYDFTNRVVAITGGAGALGSEMACALIGCGAHVAILDRVAELPQQFVERIENEKTSRSGRLVFQQTDVLDRASLIHAQKSIETQLGQVDILINAAGGNHPNATTGAYGKPGEPADLRFFDLAEDGLRRTMDLNFLGTVFPCQVFGRGMAERGEGIILNISSMNALRPLTRIPAYSAGKAAVSNFTQWLAVYLAMNYSPRIRVNALAPGFFITAQSRFLALDPATGELSARGRTVVAHTPMGRYGAPDELIGTMFWLLSPASAFVTGTIVPVDGGFSAFSGV